MISTVNKNIFSQNNSDLNVTSSLEHEYGVLNRHADWIVVQ